MEDPDRRRSLIVTLTALGLTGTVMAAPLIPAGKTMKRNLYATEAECERDYSPSQCQDTGSGSRSGGGGGGGAGSGRWRGPEYYADRNLPEARSDPGAGRTGISRSVVTSVRGGFGRIGAALRAVG
jgi:hypothetical protein